MKPLGMPKGMDPRQWRQSVEKRLNDLLDRAMSLITALDVMEAESMDLEEVGDDEPSIGWTARGPQAGGLNDDCELDDADREDSGDEHEPSLGWSAATDQHLALADYGTARDVCFFDGEQDTADEPTMGTAEAWGQGPIVGVNCHALEIIGNED
ncbi:hypothetical protein DBIPINDM_001580 [Mesorhizobium sp. AR02]|uniref:hypothetical protein n=1 Tax=Mesorhizobium sp. AR02 TaxID=2865837 RepID=UPI00215EED09|nr:hypothetical protein [Mesorhizobium sp. AR02]UVK55090.1 hypothetical protein DBIPINDM_001580 [Mesorhizobium sp. AR02]